MATDHTEFINELSLKTGLNKTVIAVWANLENGINNNILGIRSSAGPLMTFPTQKAAADATANLLKSSSNYAGIRATFGGTPAQQALAIAKSPWHLGGAGLARAGGVDPYYLSGFIKAGLLAGSPNFTPPTPSGGASTPITPSPSGTTALQSVLQEFQAIGISADPSHKLTYDEALRFVTTYLPIRGDIAKSTALAWQGKDATYIASLIDSGQVTNVNAISDLQNSLPNIDVPGAMMFLGVILVGVTFLVLGGFVILKRPKGATA